MAARATRSASRAASSDDDDDSRCLLLALSHDELGVISDGLADPLQPVVAVSLSSACLGLRTPLRDAVAVLKEQHERANAMCRKLVSMNCAAMRVARGLWWTGPCATAGHMATLGVIVRTNGLPRLEHLDLNNVSLGDTGMQSLCEGLGCGSLPMLRSLLLVRYGLLPAGAEALAAALRRRALPKLEILDLSSNAIGDLGVAALAAPLRKLPLLKTMFVNNCQVTDEGLASLVAGVGKDDFKELEKLGLRLNRLTSASQDLIDSITAGGALSGLTARPEIIGTQIGGEHDSDDDSDSEDDSDDDDSSEDDDGETGDGGHGSDDIDDIDDSDDDDDENDGEAP